APLAAGAAAQNRIAEDRTVIAENIEVGLCWFCGVNERIDGCAREVAMHGDVGRSDGRVTWRHLKVTVPRCRSCKEQMENVQNRTGFSLAIGAFLGSLTALAIAAHSDARIRSIGDFIVAALLV